jgi:NAD(P)-dependent dehydrogenase (short-subunit alcohol dehydrogenase family)
VAVLDEWAALEGKVAVVTGGAGGLGLPITEDLARAGVSVAVCDRDAEALADVTERLAHIGADAIFELFDVRESERLATFFDRVDDRFGRLDVLVNVPGGSFRKPAADLTPNGVTAVIRQNFTHVFEASQLAAKRMQAQGSGGSIVTVSTIEAYRAMPDMAVYGAMKAAVEQLTRTLAVEWGPIGIRVNTVAPDHFPTENAPKYTSGEGDDGKLSTGIVVPMGRMGTGKDLSGCVLFLASDLSSYVTGTTIHVDGGTLAAAGWMRWPDGYDNLIPRAVTGYLRSGSQDG